MDINLRLFSERLGRLLAGEEGQLPDDAKQHIQNIYSEIGIFTSQRDINNQRAFILLQELANNEETDYKNLKASVKEINGFTCEYEEVIDTFIIGSIQQQSESGSEEISDALLALQSKIIDSKQRLSMHLNECFHTKTIDQIKLFIDNEIAHETSHGSGGDDADNSPVSSGFKKRDIVGLDDKMEELLDLLIEGPSQLSVITVLDSIGFDKTAFVAEAYGSNYVKYYFDCRVWISVYPFNLKSSLLLDNLMKLLIPSSKQLSEIMDKSYQMKKIILRDCLKNKRYLLVVDDMWENNIWDIIQELLPDNHNGSRVLVTFNVTEELTSLRLENGDNIQLDSVPTTGPLRVIYHGWSFLILYHGSISLQENEEVTWKKSIVSQMLKCSTLPFHLKLCYLYTSVFPMHFEISPRQLYQLWIAEGFIADNNEAMAEDYLEQLISRGLVEVKKRKAGGTIKTCSITGRLWLPLARIAEVEEFIFHFKEVYSRVGEFGITVRRFAANADISELEVLLYLDPYLHSLLYISPESNRLNFSESEEIFMYFKFLRVLNLQSLILDQYPYGVEDLFFLRYLKLNVPSLNSLHLSSLCNLLNLYTLDMPFSYIDYTTDDIWKMNKLRHLNFGSIALPAHPGKYCSYLENLNFISSLLPKSCSPDILGRLPNLRKLRICGDLSYYQSSLSKSFCRLSCLESLKLVNERKMPWLSKIVLIEYEFPPSLTHLSLSNTELMDDPMPTLEKLPHLQVLKLKQNSYGGRKLACRSHGFPKLRVLHLKSMLWLEEWAMEIGALPKLECLVMNPCAYLKRLPEQLWCIKSLKKLELWWPRVELRQKLRDFEDKKPYDIQIHPFGM